MGRTPRQRAPEDREPASTPVYQERGSIRFELPVTVAGVPGTLVMRCYEAPGWFRNGTPAEAGDVETWMRGKAAELLHRL